MNYTKEIKLKHLVAWLLSFSILLGSCTAVLADEPFAPAAADEVQTQDDQILHTDDVNDSNSVFYANAADPSILDIASTEVTENGYKVTVSFSAPAGVSRVEFPTWTNANGQDDLIWHKAEYTDNSASYYVKTSDHKGESGVYTTHVYVYDSNGKCAIRGITVTVPAPSGAQPSVPLSIVDAKVTDISEAGYRVTVQMSSSDFSRVLLPTWTNANGQDDLVWHEAAISGDTASFVVQKSAHKGESGAYTTHVYVYDKSGKALPPRGLSASVPGSQTAEGPAITDAVISDTDETGYTVTVRYTAPAGVKRVVMPTWTNANGQDDLVWHEAPAADGSTSFRIPTAQHKGESGEYTTHIYVYDQNGKSAIKGITATVPASSGTEPSAVLQIIDARVTDISESGYRVTVQMNSSDFSRVLLPTWTDANGQDDLVWHEASINGNTASFVIQKSAHKGESGAYSTHVYVYDKNGKALPPQGLTASVPASQTAAGPVITEAVVSDVDANGYTVTVRYTAPAGVKRVVLPTWTNANGQDDIVWHEASTGNGSTSLRISAAQHKGESGLYITHIYVYDQTGKYALKDVSATIPASSSGSGFTPWQGNLNALPNNTFYGPAATSAAAALAMESQYGKYNCKIIGDTSRNVVYLTFACGWEYNGLTNVVLDILKSRGIKAVFNITGEYLNSNPTIVKRMIDEGHIVGCHSWGHKNYPSLTLEQQKNDLLTMHQAMINRFGYTMKYFSFPSECVSERSLALVGSLGYKTLGFTCYYADYDVNNQKSAQTVLDILNRGAFPGSVYFLHTVSATNASILGPWIDSMRARGFEFGLFEG